jgi:ribosomal protein S18 acetylase RimI-like enzyme
MISIRRSRIEDSQALQRLWAQLDRLHAGLHPRFFADSPRGAAGSLPNSKHDVVFVAVLQDDHGDGLAPRARRGTIVGAVKARVYDTPDHPLMVQQRRGYVEEIVVDEAHRRAGIGRRLMEEVTRWCRELGAAMLVLTVWSGNEEAEAFYRRLGYGVLNRVLGRELD